MATKKDMTPSVRVEMDYIHYLFFGTGKQRMSGTRKIPYKGGFFEITGVEIPNWHDADAFWGVLKAFDEKGMAGLAFDGKITNERQTTAIRLSTRELCFYCGHYHGGKDVNAIIKSLKRFQKTTVENKNTDEKGRVTDCNTLHTILYADWSTNSNGERHFEIAINSAFLKQKSLSLHFRSIQAMSNQLAKGIWAIIQTNDRKRYSLSFLMKQLWLDYETKMSKYLINKALKQIVNVIINYEKNNDSNKKENALDNKEIVSNNEDNDLNNNDNNSNKNEIGISKSFFWTNEAKDQFLNITDQFMDVINQFLDDKVDKGDKPCKQLIKAKN